MKECKYYCEGYYSDDIGYDEKDKIDACGLTQTGYHEMSYKKCSDITNCYYKQLLAEQSKNSELDATLKILKINHKLTISELNNEQAKNKKLVGLIETMCSNDWEDMTVFKFQKQMIKALNEVNNAK